MTKNYKSIREFSQDFHRFLYQKELLDLLPGCGWVDGGCRSLMKAIQGWLGEENVKPYQIVQEADEEHSEHAFVKIGDYFLDGDGVSTWKELYRRWKFVEHLKEVYIQPFEPEEEPIHEKSGTEPEYIAEHLINSLTSKLVQTFNKDNVLNLLNNN